MTSDVRSGLRSQDDSTCDVVIPIANSSSLAHISPSSRLVRCWSAGPNDSTGSEHAPRNTHAAAMSNRMRVLGFTLRSPTNLLTLFTSESTQTKRRPIQAIKPVVRKAASSMCGQRTPTMGPVVIAHQLSGTILPSIMACPSGTCIQLLFARIQNEENIVPAETMQQDRK